MSSVLRLAGHQLLFWCPGCRQMHPVFSKRYPCPETGRWHYWDYEWRQPSFFPGGLIYGNPRCQLLIEDGVMHYGECDHRLSGYSVPMSVP